MKEIFPKITGNLTSIIVLFLILIVLNQFGFIGEPIRISKETKISVPEISIPKFELPKNELNFPDFFGAKKTVLDVHSKVKGVYFCSEDNCEEKLIEQIKKAEQSIYCAVYDVDSEEIVNELFKAKLKGMEIGLVSDLLQSRREASLAGKLMEAGLLKVDSREGDYMHNKFCVFDLKDVWIGSYNFTFNDNSRNNNNAVLIESNKAAENFFNEFNELWRGEFGKNSSKNTVNDFNSPFEVYFCPEDECGNQINKFIEASKESIDCMYYSLTLDSVGDKLISKAEEIPVRVIFEEKQVSRYSEYERFQGTEVKSLKDKNPYNMHNKLCIFDKEIVLTGSMNPSQHSETANDESIIFIKDKSVAEIYSNYFNSYWSQWS